MATITETLEMDPRVAQSRRSTLEIMCDILEVVSAGMERPTHIIYRANISWKVLNNCLGTLVLNGLVTRGNDGKREVYSLSEKGHLALRLYRDLRSRVFVSEASSSRDTYQWGF